MTKLIIQIPCLNEETTLPATVADLPRTMSGIDQIEWLIIDDGSTDATCEVARRLGVDHIVRHPKNRGLAAAYLTGLDACLKAGADIIVNTDADNQYHGASIPDLVAPILRGDANLVVGERPIESVEEFSALKKRLQRLGSWVVRRFSGTVIRDAASGFRAVDRETALRLHVFGRYTYTLETLIQAGSEGLAVTSVPIRVNPQSRPSRLMKSTAQYLRRSTQTIIRSYAIYRPFRFFAGIALAPLFVGACLLLRWFVLFLSDESYQSRLPSLLAASALLLLAMQILLVAFLADLMAANRRLVADSRLAARRAEIAAVLARVGQQKPIDGRE